MTALPLPTGVERRLLNTARGPLTAAYAHPREGNDSGAVVIMVSGYIGSKEDFWPLLPRLAAAGCHGWAYDHLGQYESAGPDDQNAYTMDLLASDLRSVIAQVGNGRPVHLLGHCFGGFVARAAALAKPAGVRSLTMLSCGPDTQEPPKLRSVLTDFGRHLDTAGPELFWSRVKRLIPESKTALRAHWHAKLHQTNPAFLRGSLQELLAEPDRGPELRASGVPVLVMCGYRDRWMWTREAYEAMAARLDAAFAVIKGAGHNPNQDQPGPTVDALLDFCTRAGREIRTDAPAVRL